MTTTTASLLDQEPTIIPTGRDGRALQASWTAAEVGESSFDVILSVHHWKDRKAFGVTLVAAEVTHEGPFTVTKYIGSLMDLVRLPSIPAGRFSQKALEAATATAVAKLREMQDDPAVAEKIRQAVEAEAA